MQSENIPLYFRRRKARERQQKLIEEFASKQKAFMEQAMETEGINYSLITQSPLLFTLCNNTFGSETSRKDFASSDQTLFRMREAFEFFLSNK